MNFADILNAAPTSVERPKPLPVGNYQWTIQGQPRVDKSQQKGTDFVEYTCICNAPMDDVSPEALEEFGGAGAAIGKTRRLTFYVTPDSVYRLDKFLFEDLGIEFGVPRREAISMAAGRSFVGEVTHTPSKDGTQIYDNINKTGPL